MSSSGKSKYNSVRKLYRAEYVLLHALWRWKVLSHSLARQMAFGEISQKNAYNKIRRLIKEEYIIEREGPKIKFPVLQLSKKGFDHIKYDLGELREQRFKAQSVTHDYLATAFLLSAKVNALGTDVKFFTEQELLCTDFSLFPNWISTSPRHVPDGFMKIKNEEKTLVVALEIELHIKAKYRYAKMAYHFTGSDPKTDVVFWLCDGDHLTNSVFECVRDAAPRNLDIHHFIDLIDFKNFGLDAMVFFGKFAGQKIRDIYPSKSHLIPIQSLSNTWENSFREIFFPTRKSPVVQKSSDSFLVHP